MVTDSIIALIPARAGSKRIPNKNIKILAEHPLIAYTITSAIKSNIFKSVIVSTDSELIANISSYYGADVPFLRPAQYATDTSADFEWLDFTMQKLDKDNLYYEDVCILRPTNPFRDEFTIRRAWNEYNKIKDSVDSIRAVELCSQHPYKMWEYDGKLINPIIGEDIKSTNSNHPYHSMQYASLPEIYIQNASLEIVSKKSVYKTKTISGYNIAPFFTENYEGVDVNTEIDWLMTETIVSKKLAELPKIEKTPFLFEKN